MMYNLHNNNTPTYRDREEPEKKIAREKLAVAHEMENKLRK